ncbi:hypothetical protein L1887_32336 [Cichorium endivia]|nr:hypothetical protein L1887_32336 [Cichorium endivia]
MAFDIQQYKGFYEYAKSAGLDVGSPVGVDAIIDGTVSTEWLPSILIFPRYYDDFFIFDDNDEKEVAQLTCECERHIGTESARME